MRGVKRWLVLWAMLISMPCLASGYTLSQADYEKLKQDITVTNAAEFADLVAVGNDTAIADAYNLEAVGPVYVWRTTLPKREIYEAHVTDAPPTQTAWSWATFKAQTVQEREAWVEMVSPGDINPSLDQTRASFNTIFGGQGASLQQQQFLLALSRRRALRGEALFATGPGSTATPALLSFQGKLTVVDIACALRGACS